MFRKFPKKISFLFLVLMFLILPSVLAQDTQSIEFGSEVDGRIRDTSQGVIYSLEVQSGDVIVAEATSTSIDVYLRLGDSDGNVIAENDDITQTNTDARIEYTAPKSGTYYVVVLGYDKGAYTLTVTNGNGSSPQSNSNTQTDGSNLEYGDQVGGQAVDMDNPVVYGFSGQAGDSVVITAESNSVDTYLVLADANGNSLAENDDVSQDNTDAQIQAVLPANGDYLIGVYGYSSGSFTLSLNTGSGVDQTTQPVSDTGVAGGDVQSGDITNDQSYVEYPLPGVKQGDTITIDARATGGDLDAYLGLFFGDTVVAENDDRDQNSSDPFIEYPNAQAGDYSVVVTRYGFQDGETTGSFDVAIKVSSGGTTLVNNTNTQPVVSNPVASGYPAITPTTTIADWTVLEYVGADNNLEDAMLNDINEFEIGGGSNPQIRLLALVDRSDEYDQSNGDWTDTRLYEISPDKSKDDNSQFPPTVDSKEIADLGELDTSYGNNLLDFIVWGVKSYPAQHYAIIINDHGGGWLGTVVDDASGGSILHISALDQVFNAAVENTGVSKFDLLINDSCLMSNIDHYALMSRYFDYAIGSPETTFNPSFDMTLLTEELNQNPDINPGDLGKLIVDKYIKDMAEFSPNQLPIVAANVTDLGKFGEVTNAIERFATVVNENPDAYASFLGQVRANSYVYTFFLPEDQFGPQTNIDIGDFMSVIVANSKDQPLVNAAQGVVDALSDVLIYGEAGQHVQQWTHYYNAYFPARATDFEPHYAGETPLTNYAQMLRGFYGSVSPQGRSFRSVAGSAPLAPSVVPDVRITNVFPAETSVAFPANVAMEVTGRNITHGDFTVDQLQSDGSALRMRTSRIVTKDVKDGVVDYINKWESGVSERNFTWNVYLPVVSDGHTTSFEQVTTADGISSIGGRYQYPGQDSWVDVTVIFGDDKRSSNVISRQQGSSALANITLAPGGTFQTYRMVVTPDGNIDLREGTSFIWPAKGISWDYQPAPTGSYKLGFLIEVVGGSTGFASTEVKVNNDNVDRALSGYVDSDWGIVFQHPARDWFDVEYFPDSDFLQTSNYDNTEYMFVYPVYDTKDDLQAIAQTVLDRYDLSMDGKPKKITVGGEDALSFAFNYSNDSGDFTSKAFAIYRPDLSLGLVFSAEAIDAKATDELYQLLVDNLTFFDAAAVKAKDTGLWGKDTFTSESHYPVPEDWLPGADNNGWWYYEPGNATDSTTFAAITVYESSTKSAADFLQDIVLDEEIIPASPGYETTSTQTYYGELNTWETERFTHDGPDGESITGQVYVTIKNDVPYVIWFEAPTADFAQTYRDVFSVMLDGFKIDDAPPKAS